MEMTFSQKFTQLDNNELANVDGGGWGFYVGAALVIVAAAVVVATLPVSGPAIAASATTIGYIRAGATITALVGGTGVLHG